ncbi:MAG: hypothetical protein ACJ8HI_02680 [Massilia sp.]
MSEDNPRGGLSTVSEVEALADGLAAAADALHARLMKQIKAHTGDFSDAEQAMFRVLNDDEQLLRQRADSLYADAATSVLPGLREPQAHIIALTAAAAEKIRKIGMVGEVIGVVGGLLSLAGNAMSGNIAGVIDAIGQVRTHVAAAEALKPKPAAPAP